MYAPYYFADAEGLYRESGLSVKMLKGNGSLAAIDEVTGGKSDLGMASCATLMLAAGQGRDVVSIAQYTGRYSWGFYIPEDSTAQSVNDLAGKSVSMSPSSSEAVLLPAVFAIAGMEEDAMEMRAVDPSQKTSTYAREQADSVVTTVAYGEPLIQEARPSKVLLWADEGFVMPDYCLFTTKKNVEERSGLLQAFLDTTFAAIEQSAKDPQPAIAAAMEFDPLLNEEHTRVQWEKTQEFFFTDNTQECQHGWHSEDDWNAGAKTLQDYGTLESGLNGSDFFTNDFFTCDGSD